MAAPKAAAEKAFEELVRDYADCPFTRSSTEKPKSTIGEIASRELHELRQLSIGCEAPEISGVDLDGHAMSLSEYRGKVVLLVFWASWCGPCMADVPHEKELFERFKGRPFTIVGINGDTTLNAAQKAVSQNQMLWRSFGPGAATGGDIAKQWNVRVWPTVYVIDHRGIIREKHLRREELDEPLNTLIVAAEAKAP
jgi:peroxiredoxin